MRTLDCAPGRFLGRISFSLYATHIPLIVSVGCGTLIWLHRAGHSYAVSAGGAATLTVAAALAMAMAATRFVDRPSIRLADRIGRRFRASLAPSPTVAVVEPQDPAAGPVKVRPTG
jgi:peptidoglycan/LPS O-acetylase OafA/YrhL